MDKIPNREDQSGIEEISVMVEPKKTFFVDG
jgi:hypothetical protein